MPFRNFISPSMNQWWTVPQNRVPSLIHTRQKRVGRIVLTMILHIPTVFEKRTQFDVRYFLKTEACALCRKKSYFHQWSWRHLAVSCVFSNIVGAFFFISMPPQLPVQESSGFSPHLMFNKTITMNDLHTRLICSAKCTFYEVINRNRLFLKVRLNLS